MSESARPTYRLVLHDDDDHTFDYVIELLAPVLGVSRREAFALAMKVHQAGRAEVGFLELPTAREVEERLLSGGPDRRLERSKTSLTVSIEEVSAGSTSVERSSVKVLSRGRVGASGYERLDEADVNRLHETREPGPDTTAILAAWRGHGSACGTGNHRCAPSALRALAAVIVFLALASLAVKALCS